MTVADSIRGVKEGMRFGSWTTIGKPFVAGRFGQKKNKRLWLIVCQCDCGLIKPQQISNLKNSNRKEKLCKACHARKINTKHGGAPATRPRERLHNIWCGIRQRCNCPTSQAYDRYGGRGITFFKEWDDYAVFREWALSHGYADDLSIDRIDNDGNYEPSNCRWITKSYNSWLATEHDKGRGVNHGNRVFANRKDGGHKVTAFGETRRFSEWAADPRCKVGVRRLRMRITKYGWEPERAITTPPRRVAGPKPHRCE